MKSILTVHASMTLPGLSKLTGRDIDRRDRAHGFSKCGYHFVIDRVGEVSEFRKVSSEPSVHDDLADAADAVSVCLIGGVDERNAPLDNFTLPQWQSLRLLVRTVGQTEKLTSIRSKTPSLTNDRINQRIWKLEET